MLPAIPACLTVLLQEKFQTFMAIINVHALVTLSWMEEVVVVIAQMRL